MAKKELDLLQDKPASAILKFAVPMLIGALFQQAYSCLLYTSGVEETRVGYAQGSLENPNYTQVKRQISGHAECVRIVYDSDQITLEQLFDHLFQMCIRDSLRTRPVAGSDDAANQLSAGIKKNKKTLILNRPGRSRSGKRGSTF